MSVDVLAFAPHPDDAEIGCGGLLLKLKKLGYSTGIIDLTHGELSSNGDLITRQKETLAASKILKIDVRKNLSIEDCSIVNNSENRLKVIEVIRTHTPKLALIPYGKDRHPDHENSYKLLKDAFFISGLHRFNFKGKPHRPHAVICYMLNYQFKPSFIVDITCHYEDKMKACKAYASQFYRERAANSPTYINSKYFQSMVTNRDKWYGIKINSDYGEPYFLEDEIKIEDPVGFFKYLF